MSAVDFHGQPGCPYCGQRVALHPRRLTFVFAGAGAGRGICEHLVWCEVRIPIGSGDGRAVARAVCRAALVEQVPDAADFDEFFGRFLDAPAAQRPAIHAGYTLQLLRLTHPLSVTGVAIYTLMMQRLVDSVRNSLALAAARNHQGRPRLAKAA